MASFQNNVGKLASEQKSKTTLDFKEARDDGVATCTLLYTGNQLTPH